MNILKWSVPVVIILAILARCATTPPVQARASMAAPGVEKRPPYLLLHDWYKCSPVASPSFIAKNRERLDTLPFDGIVTYVRSADLKINVSAGVMSPTELSAEDVASCLEPLREIRLANLTQNFAAVLGGRPPDFLDDWTAPVRNFGLLAREARRAGLRGVYFDNEPYKKRWTDYPRGVEHPDRPLEEYRERARARGREAMAAMVKEFSDIVVILLHGPYLSEERAPYPLFPKWQHKNELTGPFFEGFVEGAGDRATVVDGGELYHLRTVEEFRDSFAWRKEKFPGAGVKFGFGIYDRPFQGREMNPDVLTTTLARALGRSDSYVWLYIEGPSFLTPPDQGGAPQEWIDAVRRARGTE